MALHSVWAKLQGFAAREIGKREFDQRLAIIVPDPLAVPVQLQAEFLPLMSADDPIGTRLALHRKPLQIRRRGFHLLPATEKARLDQVGATFLRTEHVAIPA